MFLVSSVAFDTAPHSRPGTEKIVISQLSGECGLALQPLNVISFMVRFIVWSWILVLGGAVLAR